MFRNFAFLSLTEPMVHFPFQVSTIQVACSLHPTRCKILLTLCKCPSFQVGLDIGDKVSLVYLYFNIFGRKKGNCLDSVLTIGIFDKNCL